MKYVDSNYIGENPEKLESVVELTRSLLFV